MENQRDLDRLLTDLQAFLLVLDKEKLSLEAQVKKEGVAELLARLQNHPVEDAEYMTMGCLSTSGGHGSDRGPLACPARKGSSQTPAEKERLHGIPAPRSRLPLHLPLTESERVRLGLPSHLQLQEGDNSYEEAEPVSPRGQSNAGSVDTDSSHYESYGEEEECVKDRAHYIQWPTGAAVNDGPARPESQICGFLWRKKWLGQWAKQLFIIREHLLLCYKCARDLHPLLQLDLRGCRVAYKPKHSKKMQHELKICSSSETLVMGFQSRQQAEEWRKVIEDVSSSAPLTPSSNNSPALRGTDRSRHSPQTGTDRSRHSRQTGTDRSRHSLHTGTETIRHSPQPGTERISPSPQLGTDTSRPSSQVKSSAGCSERDQRHLPVPSQGPRLVNVLLGCRWQRFRCLVERGVLQMFWDSAGADPPEHSVILAGCEVTPCRDPDAGQLNSICISKHGKDIAILETGSEDERGHWLKLLQAGSEGDPESEACSVYERTNGEIPSPADGTNLAYVGALLLRKFPTPNAYMDDPFGQIAAPTQPTRVYSNTEIPQHVHSVNGVSQQAAPKNVPSPHSGSSQEQLTDSVIVQDLDKSVPKSSLGKSRSDYQIQSRTPPLRDKGFFGSQQTLDEIVLLKGKRSFRRTQENKGEAERVCRLRTQLKAGSEMNLLSIGRSYAEASCDYVSMTGHSPGSEGTHPSTVLKRAASAKSTLKRAPSVVVIEKGRVLQKRKEWEMKAST
ncbi:actin filament-associated protein 1-like 2 [Ambystoma mexicanum]|uniref:actin filament-associated protein 1-like 2 n=1 Tax=Ambystoma mexicanum TaxID=8296 RepID=UPI0037E8ED8C